MKLESTLEKEFKKHSEELEEAVANGYKCEAVGEVFDLVSGSDKSMWVLGHRAMYIAKTIQPSITAGDLKIASDMMCALASELVLNLLNEGLISLNKKEA